LYYKHIIVIGASAGGVNALKSVIDALPADFPAPIFITMHIQATLTSYLPEIITREGKLPALHPRDGEIIQASHIYIAPPDRHMTIENDHIRLTDDPKIHFCRPAIDPLFYSAALCGHATIGIILSGMLHDGVAGLLAIKDNHGTTIIQDLDEAEFQNMPKYASEHVPIDFCLPTKDIASLLIELVHEKK